MGLPNTFPFEVLIGAPFSIYTAAAAAVRPAFDETPDPMVWTLLGTNGPKSYAEEGLMLSAPQETTPYRGYGTAAPLKIIRTSEDVLFRVTIADLTLEMLSNALNGNSVSTTPHKKIGLSRGLQVQTIALLARGPSPYADNKYSQAYIPYVANVSTIELALRRDQVTTYALQWQAVVDPNAATEAEQLGVFEAMDDADIS